MNPPTCDKEYLYNHQWEANISVVFGDSGGPMFYGNKAFGVVGYGNASLVGWGTIDWIAIVAGFRPCYSANANPCS